MNGHKESSAPTLPELCKTTLRIGAIGFGGPAILALMKKTFVQRKKWVPEQDFLDVLSLAQLLPGATGVSILGNLGFRFHGLWGGVLAPLFFILPAAIAMTALAWGYFHYSELPAVKALFAGFGALVVGLLVNATWMMGRSIFRKIAFNEVKGYFIGLLTFIGIFFLKINIFWLVLLAGFLGFVFYNFSAEFGGKDPDSGNPVSRTSWGEESRGWKRSEFFPVAFVAAILLLGLSVSCTRRLVATFMGIGTLAFGGGFSSIPLFQHQVVGLHHWLTDRELLDGIALGQVTPGPVFITATFVGYRVAGFLGAALATLAVFAPSVAGMIALSDFHARLQNIKPVRAAVKGILAGFIGLLLAVTLQFSLKSLINWQAWLILAGTVTWITVLKKDSLWAILGTILLSLILF